LSDKHFGSKGVESSCNNNHRKKVSHIQAKQGVCLWQGLQRRCIIDLFLHRQPLPLLSTTTSINPHLHPLSSSHTTTGRPLGAHPRPCSPAPSPCGSPGAPPAPRPGSPIARRTSGGRHRPKPPCHLTAHPAGGRPHRPARRAPRPVDRAGKRRSCFPPTATLQICPPCLRLTISD
jgi:hypothetical protein